MAILALIGSTLLSVLESPIGPSLGEFGIAAVGWFIQKSNANADTRRRFLDLVQRQESAGSIPAGLYAKYSGLLQSLDDKIDAEIAQEKAAAEKAQHK